MAGLPLSFLKFRPFDLAAAVIAMTFVGVPAAFAKPVKVFECSVVDGAEDYTVAVKSDASLCVFRDDNRQVALGNDGEELVATFPDQWVYSFRGKDAKTWILFEINAYKMTGTLYAGTKDSLVRSFAMKCQSYLSQTDEDWDAVQEVVDTKSTRAGDTHF